MKILLYLSLVLSLFFTGLLSAQEIKGIATYKTQRKMEIKLDSTQMSDEMQKQMMAMLRKQFEKEYTLKFNNHESIYKEAESLNKPSGMSNGGMELVLMTAGGSDVLYKNINENRFVNQNELFGKVFLIKDTLEEINWDLEKETKNIGEYTCFKATFKRMVPRPTMSISSDPEEDSEELAEEEIEQTVTAWYTLQIPVKHGPSEYGGLPGLILEISDGSQTILCSKIVLNPNNGLNINEPTKGKKVTQEEFDVIMEKKMRENREQFNSGRRGDGMNFEIRIGG